MIVARTTDARKACETLARHSLTHPLNSRGHSKANDYNCICDNTDYERHMRGGYNQGNHTESDTSPTQDLERGRLYWAPRETF